MIFSKDLVASGSGTRNFIGMLSHNRCSYRLGELAGELMANILASQEQACVIQSNISPDFVLSFVI